MIDTLLGLNTLSYHINFYGIAFLGVVFTGLNFALLLAFAKKTNQRANRFLALALLVMALWLVRVSTSDVRIPLQGLLALGPLIYFFVRTLTRQQERFSPKDLLNLIPVILEQFLLHSPVLPFLVFISVMTYVYAAHLLIARSYRQLKFHQGDRYRYELRWLQKSLTGFGLLWVVWMLFKTAGLQSEVLIDLCLGVLLIWIAVAAFLRPEISLTTNVPAYLKPALPAEIRQKGTWLKNVIKANQYFLDPELSLTSLAEKLGLTTHELSRIINQGLKKSFNDFINEYRVAEVRRKMQDPGYGHMNLMGIAYESGFNAKTTFNRAFKQATGKNPEDYKNARKKEAPIYNSGLPGSFATLISNQQKLNRNYMFKNYVKTAWRSLMRNKTYTAINSIGLTVGVAACLLIFLVVQYETSFDTFHSKKDRIYRVIGVTRKPSFSLSSGVAFPVTPALRLDFPQFKQVAPILRNEGSLFSVNDKKFKEEETYYAGPEFFQTFDFAWLAGDRNTALAEPNTLALTRDEANIFFGDWHQALGKTIRYKNKTDFKVTGILENVPANSDFPLKIVLSYATLRTKGADFDANSPDWGWVIGENYCFITLPPGADINTYNKQLDAFIKRHIPARYAPAAGMQLQPLGDMHYDSRIDIFSGHPFSRSLINAISLIGLFLLIIASVNFINLATAQAVNRSKEVGIRKVLGSNRKGLIIQFMSETALITAFSIALAIGLAAVALPFLNKLLEVQLSGWFVLQGTVAIFLGILFIAVTFLSGFYPALVLSGYNPIAALRNRITTVSSNGISLRRGLVVLQFSIAQVLVIGTLVIISQLNYFKNRPLGYAKDAIVTIPIPNDSLGKTKQASLRNQLLQQPGVAGVSFSYASPSDDNAWFSAIHFDNAARETDFGVSLKWADADYFKLYKLQFIAGGPYAATDTMHGYVINEALVKKLGLTDPKLAIGKPINLGGNIRTSAPVVGVVRDFTTGSLKETTPPVLLSSWKASYQLLNIKLQANDISRSLSSVEQRFNKTFPEALFEYHFADQQIERFYKAETQLSSLYQIFAAIAILISCLGLFGLVSFMAVQRTKEVGIRKTLGASVSHIVYLFSKEFTLLVLVAFAISAPIGAYLMNEWLQSFAFRIKLDPTIFVLAITFSVIIAWLTVGYTAIKAALVNPVKSLKSEL